MREAMAVEVEMACVFSPLHLEFGVSADEVERCRIIRVIVTMRSAGEHIQLCLPESYNRWSPFLFAILMKFDH